MLKPMIGRAILTSIGILALIFLAVNEWWVLLIIGPLAIIGAISKQRWRMNAADSSVCAHCGFDSGVPAGIAPVCQQCGRNRLVSDPRRALRT